MVTESMELFNFIIKNTADERLIIDINAARERYYRATLDSIYYMDMQKR